MTSQITSDVVAAIKSKTCNTRYMIKLINYVNNEKTVKRYKFSFMYKLPSATRHVTTAFCACV